MGHDATRLYTSVAVMVRRADRVDGVIVSAPAMWQNETEMARLVFEAKLKLPVEE